MKKKKRTKPVSKNPLVWLSVVAAVFYSSWPLGYLLNPNAAHNAFASQLEAGNQPFNWLFVSCEVISGLALIIAGCIQWRRTRTTLLRLSILGYFVFALLVIVAALAPNDCSSTSAQCLTALNSPLAIVHGLASTISVCGLLVSVIFATKHLSGKPKPLKMRVLPLATIIGWVIVGALAYIYYDRTTENLVQYSFISICSISMLVAVSLVRYSSELALRKPAKAYAHSAR